MVSGMPVWSGGYTSEPSRPPPQDSCRLYVVACSAALRAGRARLIRAALVPLPPFVSVCTSRRCRGLGVDIFTSCC